MPQKNGLTAHKLFAKMGHMIQLREGCYASKDSSRRGAAESPAAPARRDHHRAAGSRDAGENLPALGGLGTPVLCKTSGPLSVGTFRPDRRQDHHDLHASLELLTGLKLGCPPFMVF